MTPMKKRALIAGGFIAACGGLMLGQAVVFLSGKGPIDEDIGYPIDMTYEGVIGLVLGLALTLAGLYRMTKPPAWVCKECKIVQRK